MSNYKWINFLKLLNKTKNVKHSFLIFNNNFFYCHNFFFKYYNFYSYNNEFFTLKNFSKLSTDKYVLLKFFLLKNNNVSTKIFFILSNIYKIIFKKGYFLKIIQLINNILKKLNFFFFDSCFGYHIFNTNIYLEKNESSNNTLELYFFKYYSTTIFDFLIFNNNTVSSLKGFSVEYDDIFHNINYLTSNSTFLNTDLNFKDFHINNDNFKDYSFNNSVRNIFFINIFYKYFFFCNISTLDSFFLKNNLKLNSFFLENYFYKLYNINYKILSLSMFKKYYLLLFNNLKKLYHETYINFLNNFFSIEFIIPKILSSINFIFKIQVKSLSKKMKKILKNRRRFSIVYNYIKPFKRLNILLYFIKKYILISDGKDLKEKFYNVLWSLIFENKESWVSQINKIHQIECATNIKYRLK